MNRQGQLKNKLRILTLDGLDKIIKTFFSGVQKI